jgi:hypothetical protein
MDIMNEKSITEKVKTFEDACKELGLNPEKLPIVEELPEKDRKSIIAYYKLVIVIRALNEGWEPDWTSSEWKYWNYFYYASSGAYAGLVCAATPHAPPHAYSYVGSRLCFKDYELAAYAREQFRDLYFEYLFIKMPKNYGK